MRWPKLASVREKVLRWLSGVVRDVEGTTRRERNEDNCRDLIDHPDLKVQESRHRMSEEDAEYSGSADKTPFRGVLPVQTTIRSSGTQKCANFRRGSRSADATGSGRHLRLRAARRPTRVRRTILAVVARRRWPSTWRSECWLISLSYLARSSDIIVFTMSIRDIKGSRPDLVSPLYRSKVGNRCLGGCKISAARQTVLGKLEGDLSQCFKGAVHPQESSSTSSTFKEFILS